MTPPTRQTDARTRLVETADRLFYAEGVRAVGIDRVIAEAGVAKATLYAHFPGKDDLILAVLQHRDRAVMAYFEEAVGRRSGGDPVAALFDALKAWFASPDFRGCAFQNATVELADPAHPAAVYARQQKQRFHAFLRGVIAGAVGRGQASAVPGVLLLVEGAVVMALVTGTAEPADAARAAAEVLLK